MTDQPHRVTWFAPDRPVEGCTINVTPAADPGLGPDVAEAERWARITATAPGWVGEPPVSYRHIAVLLAEYDSRGTELADHERLEIAEPRQMMRSQLRRSSIVVAELQAQVEQLQSELTRTAARSSPEAPPANCPDCEWNRERGPYTMCGQHEIEGAVSPEAPAPAGPQVFNCDQSPHPPVVPCLRCEPVGGSS